MSTRSLKEFIRDITVKPLILFPLVALVHVLWLAWVIWGNRHSPINGLEWLQALWMLGYSVFWIGACDYRKWGALGYITLTIVNLVLFLFVKNINDRDLYMSPIFLIDDLFCFFLLFFYKRFR